MIGIDGGRGVADVHRLALATGLTLTLTGSHHAGLLAALLGDFNVVAFEHGADVGKAGLLETVDETAIGIVIDHRSGPGLRARVASTQVLTILRLDGTGLDRSSKVLLPRVWEIGQAIGSSSGS